MIPRSEYPRPQFVRKDWLCLNGEWEFEMDQGDSGLERGLLKRPLKDRITVPFCPESKLSGIENTDFLNAVWYRREVLIPKDWAGRRILLHFGAVDYDAFVWVNGVEVYRHRGGFTSFTCDLRDTAKAGEKTVIVVRARDDATKRQPRGKQSEQHDNYGCLYTRTTGIWQTVWMEPVPLTALERPRITPDVGNSIIRLDQPLSGRGDGTKGLRLKVTLSDSRGAVCTVETAADADWSPHVDLPIPADRRRLWEPGKSHLYDLSIQLLDAGGKIIDQATSYAGLRSIAVEGKAIKINGKTVFQRLVLDQGFYADGILTAPTDQALIADIELSMKAGFIGARLHEKVFEERFLYHADRLGYLCWGEFADWSLTKDADGRRHHQGVTPAFITQWLESLHRDYSHPCIIGWCGMNETREQVTDRITDLDDTLRGMLLAAKAMDPTRPVLDVSGYSHRVRESDVWDCHNYEADPAKLKKAMDLVAEGKVWTNDGTQGIQVIGSIPYQGQPFFNSEFGGIWWNPDAKEGEDSWGYGDRPKTLEEFYDRFERQCAVQLDNPHLFGYCYTQLTDVFQEQNGIYGFDRRPKFDLDRIRKAQQRPAAIEEQNEVSPPSKRPNLIYVFADQLGYQHCGFSGNRLARTPHIDALAASCMNFRQAISPTPVCAAYRASLFTGKYTTSTGMVINELRINPNHHSIARVLTEGGYKTAYLGKWHLWANQLGNHEDPKNGFTPPGPYRLGFDDEWAAYNFHHEYYGASYYRDKPVKIPYGDPSIYEPDAQTDMAIDVLKRHAAAGADQPLAMFLSIGTPHDPWTRDNVPPRYADMFRDVKFPLPPNYSPQNDPYADKWGRLKDAERPLLPEWQQIYYAMNANLDDNLGRLVRFLDQSALADNTLFVFTSDHGEMFGAHGRRGKNIFYEEAIHVPYMMRWPGHIPAGVSDACLATPDIMPTLLGLLNLPIPAEVEGTNLAHCALGQPGPVPEAALLQNTGACADWIDGYEWRALRDTHYTYAIYRTDRSELLFDNRADPHQMKNLAHDPAHAPTLNRFRQMLKTRMAALNDNFEACTWYRDHWIEDRKILRAAKG